MKAPPFSLHPLGDRSLCLDFAPVMDPVLHRGILQVAEALRKARIPGILDIAPAYHAIGIHYDPQAILAATHAHATAYETVCRWVTTTLEQDAATSVFTSRTIDVPVCYDPAFASDLEVVASALSLTLEEVIALHTGRTYHVFMLGFLPGFPYMGVLPDDLFMPRKSAPARIRAGSVAIAANQTGIYPLDSPGGWHIIGRTPWQLFLPAHNPPVRFQPGDKINFKSISPDAYENYQGGTF